eukprot:TRINITY_DN1186_c0_g1_i1.p1 TRINITY_DN1186_c0_g1~~TRINITY_DN1186_c0_g1_i1.p1  ORF type:complete len:230 (+),score=61.36 TRINITY_DN1186_c0_g1_i1:102-791(+)
MRVVVLSVLFLLFASLSSCFEFDIQGNSLTCFEEEFREHQLVVGGFSVAPRSSARSLEFKITDMIRQNTIVSRVEGKKQHQTGGETAVDVSEEDETLSETFAFTVAHEGKYSFCFTDHMVQGYEASDINTRRVNFELRSGLQAMDYNKVAKKEHLNPLGVELRRMEDILQDLTKELEYLRHREAEMRDQNEEINSKVSHMSVLSVFILISLGVYQIYHLKNFFHKKHIL